MAQIYDRLMFRGASYADLYRRGRPQLSINATDISFGTPFGFLPQQFDVICSDLGKLPIAHAVAASNGFPVLFGPITLHNYRGPDCPLPPPSSAAAANGEDPRARAALAIRTGLSLPRAQVDALIAAGETMIRREAAPIAAFVRPTAGDAKLARRE